MDESVLFRTTGSIGGPGGCFLGARQIDEKKMVTYSYNRYNQHNVCTVIDIQQREKAFTIQFQNDTSSFKMPLALDKCITHVTTYIYNEVASPVTVK